jgi:hypothetical protein
MTDFKIEEDKPKARMFVDSTAAIMVIEDYVPEKTCKDMIQMAEDYINEAAIYDESEDSSKAKIDNTFFRQDLQLFIPFGFSPRGDFNLLSYIQEMCFYSAHLYGKVFHSVIEYVKPLARNAKLQKTLTHTKGFSNWHIEQSFGDMADRALVWMLYLNDVEEGGTTEFLFQGVTIKPKTGTFVVWPAGVTHPHRGNPPYSNSKYILTGWLHAPSLVEKPYVDHVYNRMLEEDFSIFKDFDCPEVD